LHSRKAWVNLSIIREGLGLCKTVGALEPINESNSNKTSKQIKRDPLKPKQRNTLVEVELTKNAKD
jgi:hypothetical protein